MECKLQKIAKLLVNLVGKVRPDLSGFAIYLLCQKNNQEIGNLSYLTTFYERKLTIL